MFQKILIANRGEIALRIVRACRELGIRTVAVFSEADRAAAHVRFADEAHPIGPAPSADSYLRIDRILAAARQSGAEAVHPGYGFLAENPAFAAACEAAGLVFIGPSARTLSLCGSKTAARRLAREANVPTIPGADRDLSDEDATALASRIGFPLLIKAAAGGGGKGMRIVRAPADLSSALRAARSEGQSSFGDPAVYLEKYLERPRHIEMQILADGAGHVIYLGERECSIQRRYQKVVEEAPSPFVDEGLRRNMGEAAVAIAAAAGYRNAGTVEFLVDRERNFYFLEVNARLQVEHPVTEMVTGLDLVKAQIGIAAGGPLPVRQEEVRLRGHALECRISAEDPSRNFIPSPGRIAVLRRPGGPGVRDDSGITEGDEVPVHYDPLIAKLITWGESNRYSEIIMTRVTIPLGEDIGFLPGTEEEKMEPWMGALMDNLEVLTQSQEGGNWGRAATNDLLRNRIKIRSLNFMRGRTFLNRFLILDEAQNLTAKQMKALVTRSGPGTKVICLGNIAQIDTPYLTETTSGLTYVVNRFRDWAHAGHITLMRGERSRLADYASEIL